MLVRLVSVDLFSVNMDLLFCSWVCCGFGLVVDGMFW